MPEVSAADFPDSLALQFETCSRGTIEMTDIESSYSGREVRRTRYALGGYKTITATTAPLTQADSQVLRDFMRARRGRRQAFQFYPPDKEQFFSEPAGTVTASTVAYLPFKSGTYSAIYVGGSFQGFTITPNAGPYGEDQVTFGISNVYDNLGNQVFDGSGNPVTIGTAGAVSGAITIDGVARQRLLVRLDADTYEHSLVQSMEYYTVWTLKLKELI